MKAYVRLLDEGVDVWREIQVEPMGADLYRIEGAEPPGERWQFKPGAVVRLAEMLLSHGPALVAAAAGPAPEDGEARRLFGCRRFD
jgi:hypothetical protein